MIDEFELKTIKNKFVNMLIINCLSFVYIFFKWLDTDIVLQLYTLRVALFISPIISILGVISLLKYNTSPLVIIRKNNSKYSTVIIIYLYTSCFIIAAIAPLLLFRLSKQSNISIPFSYLSTIIYYFISNLGTAALYLKFSEKVSYLMVMFPLALQMLLFNYEQLLFEKVSYHLGLYIGFALILILFTVYVYLGENNEKNY